MAEYKVAHLGYVVKNINSSLKRFLKEGAKILIEPIDDEIQGVRICLLKIKGDIDVELVAPLNLENSVIQARLQRGGGLDHVCFSTDNIHEALRIEKEQGGLVVCPPVWSIAFNCYLAFVQRRSGLVVEFLEDILKT